MSLFYQQKMTSSFLLKPTNIKYKSPLKSVQYEGLHWVSVYVQNPNIYLILTFSNKKGNCNFFLYFIIKY